MTATKEHVDTLVERIARVCHEANRAYALGIGEPPENDLGSWDGTNESIRTSARIGVGKALEGASPRQLHESWLETKQQDGWVYGAKKDLHAKTHPCMVEYDQLPEGQRRKDSLFQAIVNALK